MTEIFRKLIDTSDVNEKEEQSVQWFRDKAQEVENVDSAKIIRNNAQSTEKRIRAGHLYLYRYNPKYKKDMPGIEAESHSITKFLLTLVVASRCVPDLKQYGTDIST